MLAEKENVVKLTSCDRKKRKKNDRKKKKKKIA